MDERIDHEDVEWALRMLSFTWRVQPEREISHEFPWMRVANAIVDAVERVPGFDDCDHPSFVKLCQHGRFVGAFVVMSDGDARDAVLARVGTKAGVLVVTQWSPELVALVGNAELTFIGGDAVARSEEAERAFEARARRVSPGRLRIERG